MPPDNQMQSWWEHVISHPAFAGLFGTIVGFKFAPGVTWGHRAFNVFCGVALSWNLSVPLLQYFNLPVEKFSGAVGFMMGLAGMHVMAAAIEWLQNGGIRSWLERR